ncbi:MAG: radical SAM protein [Acidobacteria bacterium]|nr:radical SAM protein [Acidobacteriota bacterium]
MHDLGAILTTEQLTGLQALSARHVAFSLTEACPLACRHCIVSTVPVADTTRYLSVEAAERYAGELPELAARGVVRISFTGGEPMLARRQLEILSRAAVASGMTCTIVTACHWAATPAAARQHIRHFDAIEHWHLSTDIYHLEFAPMEVVLHAAREAIGAGRKALVRMAAPVPLPAEHQALYSALLEQLPPGVGIAVQPVTRNGRGAAIATDVPAAGVPAWPCIPNGMVVRHDGTVAPCCAGLVDQRDGHPFQYPRADRAGLAAAHDRWCTDPLLQLIRTVGFAPVLQWVDEMFPDHPMAAAAPRHPCECCVRLWTSPPVAAAVRQRAERPENSAKIAELAAAIFGETFMQEKQVACR